MIAGTTAHVFETMLETIRFSNCVVRLKEFEVSKRRLLVCTYHPVSNFHQENVVPKGGENMLLHSTGKLAQDYFPELNQLVALWL